MDISDLHRYVLFLENKDQTSFHSPTEIDDAINMASTDRFKTFAKVIGEDEEAKAALDPFVQYYQVTPMNSPLGVVTLPQNLGSYVPGSYERLLSCRAISYDNKRMQIVSNDIDLLNDDELSKRLRSQLKPVTADWPVATSIGKGTFQLYPQQPNTAVFTYLSIPVKAKYGYTQSGRVLTYNSGTSVQLQWSESFWPEIMFGALKYLGINLDNPTLIEFMDQKTAAK